MKTQFSLRALRYFGTALAFVMSQACSSSFSYKEKAVPEPVKLSERLQKLFVKTKLVCFGRYALEVPQEAELIWGQALIGDDIKIISGGLEARDQRVAADIAKIKHKRDGAEITFNQKGPLEDSWQIRYYESESAKEFKLHFFDTYVTKGDLTFILGGAIENKETEETAAVRLAGIARNLRLRAIDEIPNEPGFCIDHAFLSDKSYAAQEMVNVGIYMPSLPDVTFSISSNKDAYADLSKTEYETSLKPELYLLARIEQAKKDQGSNYPSRTLLREGKRDVQHWHGEESLIRRTDGTHDFEWAFVGTPRDVVNPSDFGAVMFTKVEHNVVGAAHTASVSDAEAVALWDKLLSGLKLRVKVPNAPEGSYFLHSTSPPAPAQ